MNISLGKSYNLIGMESEDEFNRCMAKIENLHKESVFAFITDEGGQNLYPLYRGDFIYIMTEKGQTFAKIDRTFAKLIYADQTPIKTESTRLTLEELRDYLITGTCQFSEKWKNTLIAGKRMLIIDKQKFVGYASRRVGCERGGGCCQRCGGAKRERGI